MTEARSVPDLCQCGLFRVQPCLDCARDIHTTPGVPAICAAAHHPFVPASPSPLRRPKMGIEDIDMRAVLEAAFEREKHPYVNPDAGYPALLQRIGASCQKCGLPGGHPIHRPAQEAHQ